MSSNVGTDDQPLFTTHAEAVAYGKKIHGNSGFGVKTVTTSEGQKRFNIYQPDLNMMGVQQTEPKPVPMVAKKQASIPSDSVGDERLFAADSDEEELEFLRQLQGNYVKSEREFLDDMSPFGQKDKIRYNRNYESYRDAQRAQQIKYNPDFAEWEDRIKVLEDRINASKPKPVVKKAPIDTAATDFVQRDAMANVTNSQVAPNVVIQDNSVNSSSQTSTTVSNKPPMPSPLNNNRTRANAYAMV
jgi:hypothetical protein